MRLRCLRCWLRVYLHVEEARIVALSKVDNMGLLPRALRRLAGCVIVDSCPLSAGASVRAAAAHATFSLSCGECGCSFPRHRNCSCLWYPARLISGHRLREEIGRASC